MFIMSDFIYIELNMTHIKSSFHYVEIVFLNSEGCSHLKKIELNLHPICAWCASRIITYN
jgi:hypothetical protein